MALLEQKCNMPCGCKVPCHDTIDHCCQGCSFLTQLGYSYDAVEGTLLSRSLKVFEILLWCTAATKRFICMRLFKWIPRYLKTTGKKKKKNAHIMPTANFHSFWGKFWVCFGLATLPLMPLWVRDGSRVSENLGPLWMHMEPLFEEIEYDTLI